MRKIGFVAALLMMLVILSGCVDMEGKGKDFVDGAWKAGESKLIELHGEQYRKALAGAIAAGFKETEFDPNLDGMQDWDEYVAWQKKAQGFIFAEGTKEFVRTGSFEAARKKIWSLEELLGIGSSISALMGFGLMKLRNRSRKKELDKKLDRSPEAADHGTETEIPG